MSIWFVQFPPLANLVSTLFHHLLKTLHFRRWEHLNLHRKSFVKYSWIHWIFYIPILRIPKIEQYMFNLFINSKQKWNSLFIKRAALVNISKNSYLNRPSQFDSTLPLKGVICDKVEMYSVSYIPVKLGANISFHPFQPSFEP